MAKYIKIECSEMNVVRGWCVVCGGAGVDDTWYLEKLV